MVFAGPASKDDYMKMIEILTKPKVVELGRLYEKMIQFKFARNRLKKYGYREPEPSQLFETLRVVSTAFNQDPELYFRFNHFLWNIAL